MEEGVEWEVAEVVAEVVEEVVAEVVAEVAEEVVEKSVGVAEVLWKKEKHNILELEVNDEPLTTRGSRNRFQKGAENSGSL